MATTRGYRGFLARKVAIWLGQRRRSRDATLASAQPTSEGDGEHVFVASITRRKSF